MQRYEILCLLHLYPVIADRHWISQVFVSLLSVHFPETMTVRLLSIKHHNKKVQSCKEKAISDWPIKIKRWAKEQTLDRGTLPRRPESQSRLFTVDIETGVLRVLFNEAASWGLVRRLFLKLDILMYLSSCSVVHQGISLSILVRASLHCST